jgi:hypothetical protein
MIAEFCLCIETVFLNGIANPHPHQSIITTGIDVVVNGTVKNIMFVHHVIDLQANTCTEVSQHFA